MRLSTLPFCCEAAVPRRPTILICAPDEALRATLHAALTASDQDIREVASAAEAIAALSDGEVDLVIAEGLTASGAIDSLRAARADESVPILVVAPPGDVEARIAFLEAGADDVIEGGFARRELEARVHALLIRAGTVAPGPVSPGAGQTIAFFSPKGGVGTTALAVNCAALLASGGGGSEVMGAGVVLVDLDLQFGQVATHLNLSPKLDFSRLATDDVARTDPEALEAYLTPHSSGLKVLASPTSPDSAARISVEEVEQVIGTLRSTFDFVVVDCGSRLDPRTIWVLEQAQEIVYVVFPELGSLRAMSDLIQFLGEAAVLQGRTHFVVNHISGRELLKTRDVENLLRSRPTAEIPFADVDMIRSVNEGSPIVLSRPSSPVGLAIQRLAAALVGAEIRSTSRPPKAPRERRPLFSRG
ncbi:MAG TPA: AAA family ATPase [Candidatus Limnocylindria bacterium]|nr:AAA family ATPase [Candidatus Limnocylindria bacterium]